MRKNRKETEKGKEMGTIEITGSKTGAKIMTKNVEQRAIDQIRLLCDQDAFAGSKIRVMPDVHPGKVGTIGFTATLGTAVMPEVVGIDIGCGMLLAEIDPRRIEFQKLDAVIRDDVPSGFKIRNTVLSDAENFELEELCCARHINQEKASKSLGTLGGGNHFIEIDKGEDGKFYLLIHTGSRSLGKAITEHYMREGQKEIKKRREEVPYELTYLTGTLMDDYLHDLSVVQKYAHLNRELIAKRIMKGMKWKCRNTWESVHNYVDFEMEPPVLRKGAVSAKERETVIIPINMRDGVIIGTGLGNSDWNCSAPHGAGRIQKRSETGSTHTVSEFKKEMKGIYSSCIGKETLDEAPFAYRGLEEIASSITETVEIKEVLKPVYNYKAGSTQ